MPKHRAVDGQECAGSAGKVNCFLSNKLNYIVHVDAVVYYFYCFNIVDMLLSEEEDEDEEEGGSGGANRTKYCVN